MRVTKSISLVLLILPNLVSASQYVPAIRESVEFSAWVEDPEILVTVTAKINKDAEYLISLSVSYGSTTIELPEQILQVAKYPVTELMHLSYCGQSSFERERSIEHPCLALFLPYGESSRDTEADREFAYLAIDIFEGQVTGYTSYPLNGDEFEVELVH